MTHDAVATSPITARAIAHDPVLALVRSHLPPSSPPASEVDCRRVRDQALADIQRHPAALVDSVLQLAELCAALAEAAGDRLGRGPAELVETYRGLLRMVADERPTLQVVRSADRAGSQES